MVGRSPSRVALSATLVAGLALSVAAIYGRTLTGLVTEWSSSSDASYGLVLAVVAIVVAWQRRHTFLTACDPDAPARWGGTVVSIAVLTYVVGRFGADVYLTRISFVLLLVGIIWCVSGGRAVRVLAAPLTFLLIAVPLPALVVNTITLPMQFAASRIAEATLGALAVPVYRDGNILALPSTSLEVAEACSGLRSLVSLTAIGALFAWSAERGVTRRAAVVIACIPVAIVMNGLRIAATGVACEIWGRQAAAEPWHGMSGWITFALSVVVLIALHRAATRVRSHSSAWDTRVVRT